MAARSFTAACVLSLYSFVPCCAVRPHQGVLAYRMGQLNVLGAYPFHFHLLGWTTASYIKESAVYASLYRCFVIHGSSNLLVKDNTALHVAGHCLYLEDGVEVRAWRSTAGMTADRAGGSRDEDSRRERLMRPLFAPHMLLLLSCVPCYYARRLAAAPLIINTSRRQLARVVMGCPS